MDQLNKYILIKLISISY